MKKIFEIKEEVPENVEMRIKETYGMIEKSDLKRKKRKQRYIYKYSLVLTGMLCIVIMIFNEEFANAAKRGYRYIYGKGEMAEDNTAYILNEEYIVGEGVNEFKIYGIYWYENELDIFGKKKADNSNMITPTLISVKLDGVVGKNIGETDVHFKARTTEEASNEITFEYCDKEYNVSLKPQAVNDEASQVIEKESEFGILKIYPVKTSDTLYFYDLEINEKYRDEMVGRIDGEIKLYNNGKELSKEDYVISKGYIALKGNKIDMIEYGGCVLMYVYSDMEAIDTISINTPKLGECIKTDEIISNKYMTISDISVERTEEGLYARFKCDNKNVSRLSIMPINIMEIQDGGGGYSNSLEEWIFTDIPKDMPEILEYGIVDYDIIFDDKIVVELN